MDDLFRGTLQERYSRRPKKGKEQVYILLDHLTDDDIAYNVARLRKEGRALLKHSAALEAYGRHRRSMAA
jgi:hypothetical protein